ncbi:polysaccharide pyruvyl transferase family protein [Micrococcus yunnanensis]|uniref:polysaccharide pyruvyl transferase family protein n=1 Tax=Micrococcus yunnanensis TaxID=566027 RepID=UPI003AF8D356
MGAIRLHRVHLGDRPDRAEGGKVLPARDCPRGARAPDAGDARRASRRDCRRGPRVARRRPRGARPARTDRHRAHLSQLHEPFVRTLARRIGSERCVVVDARRRPGRVIEEIGRCSAVISTSLHGLIVADALGVPAAWATADPPLIGGDFKFRDHESVVSGWRARRVDLADLRDERSVRRAARPADAAAVARAQEGLVRVLDAVRRDAASGPTGVARHELRRLVLDRVARRLP